MNGFAAHGLDEDAFAEKSGLTGGLRTFDAFREFLTLPIEDDLPSHLDIMRPVDIY
jgi:hypothetical protein